MDIPTTVWVPVGRVERHAQNSMEDREVGCPNINLVDDFAVEQNGLHATELTHQLVLFAPLSRIIPTPPFPSVPRHVSIIVDATEASEDELCKLLVKIWGYKWVEFEDIPLPGEKNRDRIADAYSIRLNAQDAVRGLLRRYSICVLAAKREQAR